MVERRKLKCDLDLSTDLTANPVRLSLLLCDKRPSELTLGFAEACVPQPGSQDLCFVINDNIADAQVGTVQ